MTMRKITKEDWDKALDVNNPNFEADFNELVARYFLRMEKEDKAKKREFGERLKDSVNRKLLKDMLTRVNWISDLEVYGQIYMDPDTLLLNKYKSFLNVLEDMHMITEYLEFYGEGQEQIENIAILFGKLYKEEKERKKYNPLNLKINMIPHSISKKLKELKNEGG